MNKAHMNLRAHHVLCLLHYQGQGYDAAFTRRMDEISALLREHPETLVQLRDAPDVLCEACPHAENKACGEKPQLYDRRALDLCGWQAGEARTWEALRTAAAEILQDGRRREICGDCEWRLRCSSVTAL